MATKRKKRRKTTVKRKKATRRKVGSKKRTVRRKTARKKTTRRKKKVARKKTTTRRKKTKSKKRRKASGLTKMTYGVSSALADVVGSGRHTRPQVVKKIWAYIKKHNLQDTKNRRMIKPDAKLSKVLGSRPIDMLKMAGHISKHLHS